MSEPKIMREEPIYYDAIIGSLMTGGCRNRLLQGEPFAVITERFLEDGEFFWRAYVKIGNFTWNSSTRLQLTPGDALRELAERVDAGMDL